MERSSRGAWLSWLGVAWLLGVFIASIVDYHRGIDAAGILVAFIGQVAVAIAWTLYRPLPLWVPAGWGLIMLSGYVGLLITIPGGFDVTWSLVGLVPTGLLMILTAILEMDRSPELTR
jgi:hypothetical protein